jgi:hypothetical protein
MRLAENINYLNNIASSPLLTDYAKQWCKDNWNYLNFIDTPLINVNSSAKIVKGKKLGIETAILYMKPSDVISVITLCAGAKLFGCEKECLESSGQLGMSTADNAKIKRTILFLLKEKEFYIELRKEIEKKQKKALKKGNTFVVRLNGTTDIDFSDFIESMPETNFYDYTKIYQRMKKNDLDNYHLTFSGSANNSHAINITARSIKNGFNTVLAINTAETKGEYKLPNKLDLIPLINMDDTDARFLDPSSSVGVLKRKGSNKDQRAIDEQQNNFFFNQQTLSELEWELRQ